MHYYKKFDCLVYLHLTLLFFSNVINKKHQLIILNSKTARVIYTEYVNRKTNQTDIKKHKWCTRSHKFSYKKRWFFFRIYFSRSSTKSIIEKYEFQRPRKRYKKITRDYYLHFLKHDLTKSLVGSRSSNDSTLSSEPFENRDVSKVESYAEQAVKKEVYNPKDDPNHPFVCVMFFWLSMQF